MELLIWLMHLYAGMTRIYPKGDFSRNSFSLKEILTHAYKIGEY